MPSDHFEGTALLALSTNTPKRHEDIANSNSKLFQNRVVEDGSVRAEKEPIVRGQRNSMRLF